MHHSQLLNELNILRCSVILELFFGITGILVAIHSGSQAVFLDGSYSLLCTLTMMANVRVSRVVRLPPSAARPYGLPTLEPLMLFFEGLILLGLCLTLLFLAIYRLYTGGYIPEFDLALAYEIFSTIVGGGTASLFFLLHLRSGPSPLIYFEFQEWLIDAAVSAAATLAFSIACLLGDQHPISPYIDAILTLFLLLFLTHLPLKTLRKNVKQLLLQDAVSPRLLAQTRSAISAKSSLIARGQINMSMIWLGRWLWVNIEIIVHNDDFPTKSELQDIRAITESTISPVSKFYRIQLSLSFSDKENYS